MTENPTAMILHPLEKVPENENKNIRSITNGLKNKLIEENLDITKMVIRKFHGHHHGCLKARFTIKEGIEDDLKYGIFKNAGKSYDAIIRFSNLTNKTHPDTNNDRLPDARGMGIKIYEDGEPIQDFLMTNYPVFMAANAMEFWQFIIDKYSFYEKREREFEIVFLSQNMPSINPLGIEYFSMTPYALGPERAMKFKAQPCEEPSPEELAEHYRTLSLESPNYLMEAMKGRLKLGRENSEFDFKIQLRPLELPENDMPIEDATILWPEKRVPFQTVASITIEPQEFDTPAKNKASDYLSFNPWHSDQDLRPLGGINRVRRSVYYELPKYRLDKSDERLPGDNIRSTNWAKVIL